jgi:hypothetical protein
MRTHKHHIIPKSRGGNDDPLNLVELSEYDHAYQHALDFVLFDNAPMFDFRQSGWKLLPEDLRSIVLKKLSRIRSKAMSGKNHPMFGKTHSEEARQKISRALSGQNNPNFGKPRSEETKQKIAKANKNKTPSEETRKKISEAGKKRIGENSTFFGKTHSEETKQRMSKAKSGKNHPNFGKSLTKEVKQKISEAAKKRWAKKRKV